MDASASESGAWDATLQFLDYRSFLNADFAPSFAAAEPITCLVTGKTHILTKGESADEVAKSQSFSMIGAVSANEAARFDELDNLSSGCGAQFIVFQMSDPNNALQLDGLSLKNVIIVNTKVTYLGAAVKLENVFFVNCTFDLPATQPVRNFAIAVLSNPSVSFDAKA